MCLVPHRDQVVAALADVLGVDEAAPKCAGRIQGAQDAFVHFDLDLDVAVQVYAGCVDGDAGVDGATIQQQADECLHLGLLDVLDDA